MYGICSYHEIYKALIEQNNDPLVQELTETRLSVCQYKTNFYPNVWEDQRKPLVDNYGW